MATTTTPAGPETALELRPPEQEVLLQEIRPFAATLKDPAARERYLALDRAAEAGAIPTALVPALEAMLELVLQTRRLRQRHGPEAEQTIGELFHRTPRGVALRQAAAEVNRALAVLQGQALEKLTVLAGPGRYTLVVNTDRCRLTLKLDPGGPRIEQVEVGG